MRLRTAGWHLVPAAFAAAVLTFGLAGVASAQAVNQTPTPQSDTVTVKSGHATTIDVLSNDTDPDGNTLTVISVSTPAHGAVAISHEGKKVTYTPTNGYLGADTFTYVVSDGALTAAAAVNVTVIQKTVETTGTSAKVQAACQAYSGADNGVNALCGLYLGAQLPAWAQENIGQIILKRATQMNKAEIICAATTTDATLTALCGIYKDPTAPAWLKKSLGGMVEHYVKASTSSSIEIEKNKSKDHNKNKDHGKKKD
ncbi:MAG: Ig-like domain-containing protein [Chloroflexi bacterium]|nr:Ig-like domain-containing protein [Chloroflexota bacterium]MDA1239213.1 Ig-like domain-containing protein [Chloroflexota bacterium]